MSPWSQKHTEVQAPVQLHVSSWNITDCHPQCELSSIRKEVGMAGGRKGARGME